MTSNIIKIIFCFIAIGILDGIAAVTILGNMNFSGVWKYVASGFFGEKAFKGGYEMVYFGIAFHMLVSLIWSIVYYFTLRKVLFFQKNKIIGGLIYGVIIWLIMTFLILPFTNVPKSTFIIFVAFKQIVILMLCVGLPISFLLNWNKTNEKTTNR
jgi:hypothetical protein